MTKGILHEGIHHVLQEQTAAPRPRPGRALSRSPRTHLRGCYAFKDEVFLYGGIIDPSLLLENPLKNQKQNPPEGTVLLLLSHLTRMFSSRLDLLEASNALRGPSDAPKRPFFPLKTANFGLEERQSAEDEEEEEEKAAPFPPTLPRLKLCSCDMNPQKNLLDFCQSAIWDRVQSAVLGTSKGWNISASPE